MPKQLIQIHAQDRAVALGLADGTYEVLEEKMASLLDAKVKLSWFRQQPSEAAGFQDVEGPDIPIPDHPSFVPTNLDIS